MSQQVRRWRFSIQSICLFFDKVGLDDESWLGSHLICTARRVRRIARCIDYEEYQLLSLGNFIVSLELKMRIHQAVPTPQPTRSKPG